MRFETRAIHDGQPSDSATGAVVTPVYQTSTYQQSSIGVHKGYEYSRTGNPTRTALELALASLEEGKHGLAFASGLAATTAVFSLLKAGDHVIAGDDLYGGTYRLLEKVFAKWGITASYVAADDPSAFAISIRPNTRLIWLETPTNPLLKLVDIKRVAAIAGRSTSPWPLTIPSPAPTSRNRCSWARTWWYTAPPNTWPGTATSSVARW